MFMTLVVNVPNLNANQCWVWPDAAAIRESRQSVIDAEYGTVAIDSLGHGCGCVAVVFNGRTLEDPGAFGFYASVATLDDLIAAMQMARNSLDREEGEALVKS